MGIHDKDKQPAGAPAGEDRPADEVSRTLEELLAGAGGAHPGVNAGLALESLSALLLLQALQGFERAGARQDSLGRIGEATTAEGVTQIYTLGGIAAAVGGATLAQSAFPQYYLSMRAAEQAFR